MAWNDHREPYGEHILNLVRYIDLHSEQYARTGDSFHYDQYTKAVRLVEELKAWIKTKERKDPTQ